MRLPPSLVRLLARTATLAHLAGPTGAPAVGAVARLGLADTFARAVPAAGDLLGLQVVTHAGTRAALALSGLMAGQHRTLMGILHNIGR